MTNDAKRTYRGPIIEWAVEFGVVCAHSGRSPVRDYVLAVDDGMSDIVLLRRNNGSRFLVSRHDPTYIWQRWTVTP